MKLTLRPTANTDVWFLSENMRLMDQLECGLSRPGVPLLDCIRESVETTQEPLTAVDPEGEPVAIFGCAFSQERAYPWMLSSPQIKHYARDVVLHGRFCVSEWHALARELEVRLLCNWIHKKNHSARRFVQALGFTILPAPNGDFDFFYANV